MTGWDELVSILAQSRYTYGLNDAGEEQGFWPAPPLVLSKQQSQPPCNPEITTTTVIQTLHPYLHNLALVAPCSALGN